jgi:phosphatidylserine decarboxylase
MDINIPREPIYSTFGQYYGVNTKDMVKSYRSYSNFNSFFTRPVRPRTINPNPNIVVSSTDSKVLSVSKVRSNDCLLVKGISYRLGHFITGYKNYEIGAEELTAHYKLHTQSTVWSCILYLAPGDYHRYHSPVDFLALRRTHILGTLSPVKESYISKHSGVYEGNERVVL